ncbi:ligase-associated DNA damage response exonuclease [Fodinicurvata sp. EGI_FJ10296]|uniref:ligase-associated DNA damage response exonuclease n=1 Tax=Fodinicurvata sp. EGI_FJ10296 TaxID=3231908 RepID=UPI00345573B5
MEVRPEGLYCRPGAFYIDPSRAVDRALITHGHADHARPGHRNVLATPETLAIMRVRYAERAGERLQPAVYGDPMTIGGVSVRFVPAGHVLGSAQIVLEYAGARVVVSGDYKRGDDPTCTPFEPVPCDVFVTEATFGLPVFRHPDPAGEIKRLLESMALFPERSHALGTYGLGKTQRVIALLRRAGYDRTIYLHGALVALCALYEQFGVPLGAVAPATGMKKADLARELVLAPPSAIADRWARRLADPVVAAASGWMRVRQRAKQGGVELPLIISDHADWNELLRTIDEVEASEVWVTHGREEALILAVELQGRVGRALNLLGYDEESGE